MTDLYVFFCRSVLCELTQLSVYRQKEIINEISRYVYPIVIDKKQDFAIANIKLLQADGRIYQAPSSKCALYEMNSVMINFAFFCEVGFFSSQIFALSNQ
jgi:hypothetical protein